MTLLYLRPGSRFAVPELADRTGTLIAANDCRAVVRWDGQPQVVDFQDGRIGQWVRIVRQVRPESVTPYMQVRPI